jgi:hypothetical protein
VVTRPSPAAAGPVLPPCTAAGPPLMDERSVRGFERLPINTVNQETQGGSNEDWLAGNTLFPPKPVSSAHPCGNVPGA